MTEGGTLSPEFKALCCAVRLAIRGDGAEDFRRQAALVGDWKVFVAGAVRHRVVAMAHDAVATLATDAFPPQPVMERLRRHSRRNAALGLAQVAELGRLFRLFEGCGLRVLVLKGVVLSQRLFGDAVRRGVGDMDLLIDPVDLSAAHVLLTGAGYVCHTPGTAEGPHRQVARYGKDVTYTHPDGHVVELHLCLNGEGRGRSETFAGLWQGRTLVPVGNTRLPTLADDELGLYLIVHGARHCWDRLAWLADVAVLLADDAIRRGVCDLAAARGQDQDVRHCLGLMASWFDEGAATGGGRWRLNWFVTAFFSQRRWLERPRRGSGPWLALEIRRRFWRFVLAGDWRRTRDALVAAWFNPVDAGIVALPRWAYGFYPLLRPYGWVVRNFIRRRD